jgi:Ca-activated chloride channel homolog
MTSPHEDSRLTAYALGELDEFERSEVEALIADDFEAQSLIAEIQATARFLAENLQNEAIPGLAPEHHQAIETRLDAPRKDELTLPVKPRPYWARFAIAAGLIGLAATLLYPSIRSGRRHSERTELALNKPEPAVKLSNSTNRAPAARVVADSKNSDEVERIDRESRIAVMGAEPFDLARGEEASKSTPSLPPQGPVAASRELKRAPSTPSPDQNQLGKQAQTPDQPQNPNSGQSQGPQKSDQGKNDVVNPFLDNSLGRRTPIVVGSSPGGVGNYSNNLNIPQSQGEPNQPTPGRFAGEGGGIGGSSNLGAEAKGQPLPDQKPGQQAKGEMYGMQGGIGGMKPQANQPGQNQQGQQGQDQQPGQGQQPGQKPGQGQGQQPGQGQKPVVRADVRAGLAKGQQPGQGQQPGKAQSSNDYRFSLSIPSTQGSASNIQPFNAKSQPNQQEGPNQPKDQSKAPSDSKANSPLAASSPPPSPAAIDGEARQKGEEGFLNEMQDFDKSRIVADDQTRNGVSYPKSFKLLSERGTKMKAAEGPGEAGLASVPEGQARSAGPEDLRKEAEALDRGIAWAREMNQKGYVSRNVLPDLEERRRKIQEQLDRGQGGDAFTRIVDNPFLPVEANPLSTFSIDVDTASYANVRRYITQNMRPPADAVRIEELINYFPYSYPQPKGDDPFSVNLEVARCPWDASHRLVRIGLKGRVIDNSKRPPSNLVFLIDVSGSMNQPDKLPLLKAGMKLLVDQLGENDRVAIVVYASAEGLALSSTSCSQKEKILSALEELRPGGSTNGGRGIQLAYDIAVQSFIKGGTNRVILATDGDFNVGVTEGADLDNLIVKQRETGVSLSVLGFGQGNVKHDKLESLADKGNGQYSYIDTIKEARKVLIEQISGTLVTIAKDVKIQVKFNPSRATSYRLIGYENRVLQAQDFANDKKDAGEIGAGHCVTALYEIVPPPAPGQGGEPANEDKPVGQELLNVDLRCKAPDGDVSKLISFPALDHGQDFSAASDDYKFAASVAGFGMLLRNSPYKGTLTWTGLTEMARGATGPEPTGYRQEFLELIGKAQGLEPRQ